MRVNRPQGQADPLSAGANGPSVVDRLNIVIVRLICVLGLVLANYYSWSMTVTGFVNARYLPDNSVLANDYIPYIVAGFVQLGILAFYLLVPYFQRRFVLLNLVASAVVLCLIGLSAVFALYSITLTSQSETIVSYRNNAPQTINNTIVELDKLIASTFSRYLDDLDGLAQRACQGKDRTGIAQCGPISKKYNAEGNVKRATYGSRLAAQNDYSSVAGTDMVGALTLLRGNYLKLAQKMEVFRLFTADANFSATSVSNAFDDVGRQIETFSASLNERNPDTKTLVLEQVFKEIVKALSGTATLLFLFSLTIALLPDILSIVFTVLLIIARGANQEAMSLRRAARKAVDEAELYEKYAEATDILHRAKQRWRDRRRVANVAEAVDQSVPDTV